MASPAYSVSSNANPSRVSFVYDCSRMDRNSLDGWLDNMLEIDPHSKEAVNEVRRNSSDLRDFFLLRLAFEYTGHSSSLYADDNMEFCFGSVVESINIGELGKYFRETCPPNLKSLIGGFLPPFRSSLYAVFGRKCVESVNSWVDGEERISPNLAQAIKACRDWRVVAIVFYFLTNSTSKRLPSEGSAAGRQLLKVNLPSRDFPGGLSFEILMKVLYTFMRPNTPTLSGKSAFIRACEEWVQTPREAKLDHSPDHDRVLMGGVPASSPSALPDNGSSVPVREVLTPHLQDDASQTQMEPSDSGAKRVCREGREGPVGSSAGGEEDANSAGFFAAVDRLFGEVEI